MVELTKFFLSCLETEKGKLIAATDPKSSELALPLISKEFD